MNNVNLIGNLTRDVEVRYLGSGKAVGNSALAINDRYKNAAGEWVDDTTFVDMTFWGRTAEVAAEYAHKGSKLAIEGKLKQENWNDKQTGAKRSRLIVTVTKMHLLDKKSEGGGSQQASEQPAGAGAADDGDVPF